MPRNLILLFLFFSVTTVSAQNSTKPQCNSLLWRITGNGLSKPSYLFGTMHITDKRVFYFSDSLYHSLEQCEGFAAELDMTNLMTTYLNELFNKQNDESESSYIVNDVDERILDRYKTSLERKFKKPIDKITEKEIKKEADWAQQKFLQGEMPTFMDAYLFDIARKQGKWVGGIEDFEDQFSKIENESPEEELEEIFADKKEVNKRFEWMVKTYLKQDLDAIDKSEEIWQGDKDFILISRNAKMSRRIDSLAHIRSCLFAIGAAHLPGDSGVVSLLRKRGFTVSPVYTDKKIAPGDYKYKAATIPWVNVYEGDSSYVVQMPFQPDSIKMFEDLPFGLKANYDLSSMRYYFTMAIPVAEVERNKGDSLINTLSERYKTKLSKLEQKNIVKQGINGKEFISDDADEPFRMQTFFTGGQIAINYVYSLKREALFGKDPDYFFNSFKVLPRKVNSPEKTSAKWQNYVFERNGFSIMLPGKYKEKKMKPNISWYQQEYESIDMAGSGAYYSIILSEAKPGYFSDEDSAYFEKVVSSITENEDIKLLSMKHLSRYGFPAFEALYEEKTDDGTLNMKTLMLNRGNRRYYVIASYYPDKISNEVDQFFSSFKLLPVHTSSWHMAMAPDHSFTLWSPSEVRPYLSKDQFYVYDSSTATAVYIEKKAIPSFYWVENDSLLFSKKLKNFTGWNDSLLNSQNLNDRSLKGIQGLVATKGNQNFKNVRILLNGDTLYYIYSFLPKEQVESKNYERLFNEFSFENISAATGKLYQRKPAALLTALGSQDSTEFEEAKKAFEEVDFNKEDLPLLQKATLIQYKDFDSSYYYNINAEIINIIESLDSDHTMLSFIKENYKEIQQEYLKPFFISYLSYVKTNESYRLLKELLVNQPPKIENAYYVRYYFYDSLELARTLFPEILSTISNEGMFESIAGLTTSLLDSNFINRDIISKYKEPIFEMAKRQLERSKDDLEADAYEYYDLVKLLGVANTPESYKLIRKFEEVRDKGLRMQCIVALLKNNQPVNRVDLFTLATSDQFRSDLYDELKELGKEKLFPREYLSQQQLGKT